MDIDAGHHTTGYRWVLKEAVAVTLAGLVLALAANQISPRGLSLGRDYFPQSARAREQGASAPANGTPAVSPTARGPAPTNSTAARLQRAGLQLIATPEALRLYQDPRYGRELIVFVDARGEQAYRDGHIPGAYLCDRFYLERYLAAVLPVCQTADLVVVYCTGGDCEDSEFTAVTLEQAGVARTKLMVYGGGMSEWVAQRLPVEVGARQEGGGKGAAR